MLDYSHCGVLRKTSAALGENKNGAHHMMSAAASTAV
jgi:hypothetical protein